MPFCCSDFSVSLTCVSVSMDYFCLTRFLQNTSRAGSPALPSSSKQSSLHSPVPGVEFPKAAKMSTPQRPRLGTGFSEGEDILFFDRSPPPRPKLDSLAEAKKVTALWVFVLKIPGVLNCACLFFGVAGALDCGCFICQVGDSELN